MVPCRVGANGIVNKKKSMKKLKWPDLLFLQGEISKNHKGSPTLQKRMNFRKSSKRPLTPPSFSENHIADFLKSCTALKTIYVVYF